MKKFDLNSIGEEAQNYFKNEKLLCSESVLKAIVINFDMNVDDSTVRVASVCHIISDKHINSFTIWRK
ncbi:hypothetical protein [Terrisporobacter mayombei]|uniref:Uncharacterized protein n=1 Tax=Terrisporobacter mayombei TaxID=1541 RepID=A0ABY9Q1U0_9FIRM|nr:hypothetical protein [Terrisporobacter mayombei]MCC3867104.1 hypothetical protein [Terrisporobacter mayombei]WMT81364.1 hypothetical protein TEMA_17040 [Terrisporobacter mayombei]